jgi:spermidine/putrescine ABC transporter ATP-binding subunit
MSIVAEHGPATAGAAVTVRNLRRVFGPVVAVDDVTLEVKPGEFVALLGPSGSGKTTILMSVAGFETPDAGSIEIGGVDVTHTPPNRRGIGMVFQRYALFPHMTVAENVAFPLKMRKIRGQEAAEKVEQALAMARLSGYGGRRINQLSGGQQQRVALARALVYGPPLLLMDEPLGALDKNLREDMQLEIKRLQKKLGTTVIYVTHDQSEALTMADRIAVMSNGRIQQFGAPADIYDRPDNAFVAGFIGETNFLDGELINGGGGWHFRVADSSATIAVPGASDDAWRAGLAGRLAIRPELIRVRHGEGPGPAGILEELVYGGGTVACFVRLSPSVAVTARVPAAEATELVIGRAVNLLLPADRVRVFIA